MEPFEGWTQTDYWRITPASFSSGNERAQQIRQGRRTASKDGVSTAKIQDRQDDKEGPVCET
jgi:hypothetical protein